MAGNPKNSKWRVTPNEQRKRKNMMLTLSPEAIERLTKQAETRGLSRSEFVEELVLAAPIKPEPEASE